MSHIEHILRYLKWIFLAYLTAYLVQRRGRKDNALHVEIVLVVLDFKSNRNADAARFRPLLRTLLALVLLALVAIHGVFNLALVGRRLEF